MSWKEDYRVFDAVDRGIKPEDIVPPLDRRQLRLYEQCKKAAGEAEKEGRMISWFMPNDD